MIEATNKDVTQSDSVPVVGGDLHSDNTPVPSGDARASQSTLEKLIANPYVHLAVLLLIVGLCFGRTLTSYFLADDFGEVSYVSRIFNGEPHLFWSNFTGNYMQIPGMNVYRPWLLVSLVIDFLLYRANAVGYYFTNLSFFTGVVFLIYFVTRQLTRGWSRTRSAVAAFFGAALFAANPLRCESVSWVVGRVDIVCCFFYLSSYLLFLKSRNSVQRRFGYTAAGILAFLIAMGTKEMAIGLPVLLALTAFFGIGDTPRARSFVEKLRDAASFSAPLWACTVVYFVIRYACLGTLGGGYVAGFGASQVSYMVQRWMDPDTIKRLFFPFCHSLFNGHTVFAELLTLFYGALAGLALIRLVDKKLSLKWFLFLTGWLATAAVPIFQLWGLGFDLEGARFYFFLSIPLCLMAPILLFRPNTALRSAAELKFLTASAVTLTAIGCILGRVAALTDLEWVHAGKENKQVSLQAQKLAVSARLDLIPVLGIPKERSGAHQILNGSTFNTMLSPPFTSTKTAQRFATFDPIMFGPSEYIDAGRFKSVLQNSLGEFFVWNATKGDFEKRILDVNAQPIGTVDLPLASGVSGWLPNAHARAIYKLNDGAVEMTSMQDGDSVRIGGLNINPLAADFIQFDCKAEGVPDGAQFTVYSAGTEAVSPGAEAETTATKVGSTAIEPVEARAEAAMFNSDSFRTVRVRLSRYWRWFCQGNLASLSVQPYPCQQVTMRNFRLLSADQVSPSMILSNKKCDGTGIYKTSSADVVVSINQRQVKGATGFEIEIGKVNYFFNNFEKVAVASPVQSTVRAGSDVSTVHIDANEFATPGFYELRARCLDVAGQPIGEYSDNLTLRISQTQPAAAKN